MYKVMVINLGGTSTKLALYDDETLTCEGSFRHTDEEIAACVDNAAQIAFRTKVAQAWIQENGLDLDQLDAVVFRMSNSGGMTTVGGTYCIEGRLKDAVMKVYEDSFPKAMHPSFIAYPLILSLLDGRDVPVYAVDPDDVSEFSDVACVSGHPDFPRSNGVHMLNQKAVGRKAAADLGKKYQDTKLVVAHLGGGVSIASHDHGRVVDGTHGGPAGEGPFATTRSGALPIDKVAQAICSGKLDMRGVMGILMAKGGFVAHTGLTDMRLIEKKAAEGDANCDLVIRAFIYHVCRYIGAQFAALGCEADAIVLTGGIAYSKRVVEAVTACVSKLAPVMVYPGEEENTAMVAGVLRVLRGEEELAPIKA